MFFCFTVNITLMKDWMASIMVTVASVASRVIDFIDGVRKSVGLKPISMLSVYVHNSPPLTSCHGDEGGVAYFEGKDSSENGYVRKSGGEER